MLSGYEVIASLYPDGDFVYGKFGLKLIEYILHALT